MQKLWCWRCKRELGMLDKEESEKANQLYANGFRVVSIERISMQERFKELLDFYNNLTGENETNPNAIMHHQITMYGSPCEKCGKPYRTPKASFCAACGNKRL